MNPQADTQPSSNPTPHLNSRAILGDHRKVEIEHEGNVYTLQVTRQGKLLLTK